MAQIKSNTITAQISTITAPEVKGGVAIIPITGVMFEDRDIFMEMFGGTSTSEVTAAVTLATHDSDVKSILLVVNSPGGQVSGMHSLGDSIFSARKVKPVFAQVNGIAASAAYYAISQADKIFVGRMDTVGSIGIRAVEHDVSEAFANDGVKTIVVDTGIFKSSGEPGTVVTDEHIAELQRIVDVYFEDFIKTVSRGRGMTSAAVRAVADGRMLFPQEAKESGLIDGVQDLTKTFEMASKAKAKPSALKSKQKVAQEMLRNL